MTKLDSVAITDDFDGAPEFGNQPEYPGGSGTSARTSTARARLTKVPRTEVNSSVRAVILARLAVGSRWNWLAPAGMLSRLGAAMVALAFCVADTPAQWGPMPYGYVAGPDGRPTNLAPGPNWWYHYDPARDEFLLLHLGAPARLFFGPPFPNTAWRLTGGTSMVGYFGDNCVTGAMVGVALTDCARLRSQMVQPFSRLEESVGEYVDDTDVFCLYGDRCTGSELDRTWVLVVIGSWQFGRFE